VVESKPSRLRLALEMIKFPHTVFALPFALIAALMARRGWPSWRELLLILVAMVGARSAAMAFNRIADRRFDALNPRTRGRPLVSGALGLGFAVAMVLLASAMLVGAAWLLNPLAFKLSPLALLILLGYSYTKRFTWASHLALGLALGGAPLGAWIALEGTLALPPLLLGLAVLTWVAGFDIIYACQDVDFDQKHGLHSIPARFGIERALTASALLHALTIVLLLAAAGTGSLGWLFAAGVTLVGALLFYEHRIVTADNLDRLQEAFFTVNGAVSIVLLLFAAVDQALIGGQG
jgi:4-hydroxybenzoate polyprenyltransferase